MVKRYPDPMSSPAEEFSGYTVISISQIELYSLSYVQNLVTCIHCWRWKGLYMAFELSLILKKDFVAIIPISQMMLHKLTYVQSTFWSLITSE